MTNNCFLFGYPAEFKNLCLVYPPRVKEVLANKQFNIYSQMLTISQEEIEDEFIKANLNLKDMLTPFEYILNNAYHDDNFRKLLEDAFYFFIHEPVMFAYERKEIVIGDVSEAESLKDLRYLGEEDYFDFQNHVREAVGSTAIEPPNPNEDPRIKAIKAKARYRDKIKAKKGMGLSLETSLTSICYMGCGISPLNIGELSYAAVPKLIRVYQEKEKYDLDVKSLLAGADSKKIKPKYWIRNLDD